jgi:filamin
MIEALPPSSEETGFSIEYKVTSPGDYLITINDKGKAIPGSPFKSIIHDVEAKKNLGDHSRVKVVGPGMVTGLVGKPARFYVDSQHAGGGGKLHMRLVGPAKAQLREVEPGYGFEYIPAAPGKHLIYITFNDHSIPNSPFTVNIKEDPERKEPYGYPSKIILDGDALHGGSINKPVWFDVLMAEAGAGELRVNVTGPEQGAIRDGIVGITNDPRNCSARVTFEPLRSGNYQVEVKFANENVPRSPFVVFVN